VTKKYFKFLAMSWDTFYSSNKISEMNFRLHTSGTWFRPLVTCTYIHTYIHIYRMKKNAWPSLEKVNLHHTTRKNIAQT
jgi:hypothetical protein